MAAERLRVLIVTGEALFHHNWRRSTATLVRILESSGRFDVRVTEEFRGATAETLAPYDVVVLNFHGRWDLDPEIEETRFGAVTERALVEFVEASGKGLVVYHDSVASGRGWDDFERLSGGVLRGDKPGEPGRRGALEHYIVRIREPHHPITDGLPEQFWDPFDDMYVNLTWHPRADVQVLATAWDNPYRYSNNTDHWASIAGIGDDQPAVWVQESGAGRVFTITLGHGSPAMDVAEFQTLLTRGAEWAATGAVTLAPVPYPPEGPTKPGGNPEWDDDHTLAERLERLSEDRARDRYIREHGQPTDGYARSRASAAGTLADDRIEGNGDD